MLAAHHLSVQGTRSVLVTNIVRTPRGVILYPAAGAATGTTATSSWQDGGAFTLQPDLNAHAPYALLTINCLVLNTTSVP